MLFPDRNWLLGDLPIIVPVGGIAVRAWEWQTLAVILFATIVVWLLFGAAREERPCLQKRVLALLWQIYSRRFLLPIHFRQCGHRFGGS